MVLVASSASAQRPLEETSEFWREVRAPGQQRARTLTEHALGLIRKAREEMNRPSPRPYVRAAFLEGAIQRLELARRHAPRDPEVLFYLARAVAEFERPNEDGPPERRDADAVALYHELRALDADFLTETVGFELGVLHSRTGDFEDAAREYRHALAHTFDVESVSVTHANLAEVRMMAGALEEAVHHYERAIDVAEHNPVADQTRSLALAHWGRAVALDRLGEHRAALESARRAMSIYGGAMSVLRSQGVFFDPPSEIHYYEALGWMAKAERDDEDARGESLENARSSWQQYLALSPDDDPWRSLAEQHAREVAAAIRE